MEKVCKFPECNQYKFAKKYCTGHYGQLRKYNGDETKLKPLLYISGKTCGFIDHNTNTKCDRPHYGNGYCNSHWRQLRKNGFDKSKLTSLLDKNNRDLYYQMVLKNYPDLKTREEIDRRHKLLGITHFQNPSFYESHGRWIIRIFYNNSNKRTGQLFSKHIMELKLLRRLKSDGSEDVDHIDEDRGNDHIDNLQILANFENVIKSNKSRFGDYYKAIHEFICPTCGEISKRRLKVVRFSWKQNYSGPTCSHKCNGVVICCKSLTNGQFKSTNDDIIGRFIEGVETEKDKGLIQPTKKELELLSKWRLYFKDKKEHFNKLIKTYHKQDNIRDLDNSEVSLCLKLLSRYNKDLTLYDDFYNLFRNETINWKNGYKLKFLVEALYRYDVENGNSDMSYKLYKYFDL